MNYTNLFIILGIATLAIAINRIKVIVTLVVRAVKKNKN